MQNVSLESDGLLQKVEIEQLDLDYRFLEVINGKLRAITGQGIYLELDLQEKKEKPKEPFTFPDLAKLLESIRERVIPVEVDLRGVQILVEKEGERVVDIGKTDLLHQAGDELIEIKLGRIIDATGRSLAAQEVEILWNQGELTIDQVDVLPILGLRDVKIFLPESGALSADLDLRLNEAFFHISGSPGLTDIRMDLREGELVIEEILRTLRIKLPLKGRLTSLSLGMLDLPADWKLATGEAELILEDVDYDGWSSAELAANLELSDSELTAKIAGTALGSGVMIDARSNLDREVLQLSRIDGTLEISEADVALQGVSKKLWEKEATEPQAPETKEMPSFQELPISSLGGSWYLDFVDGRFDEVGGDLLLDAEAEETEDLKIVADYSNGVVNLKSFESKGIALQAVYDVKQKTYQGSEVMDEFASVGVEPWLKGIGLPSPGEGVMSLRWEGSGDLSENTHEGVLSEMDISWRLPQGGDKEGLREPIELEGELIYDWPEMVQVNGLVARTMGQQIKLDAALQDQELRLDTLEWTKGDKVWLEGTGTMPVPEDFSNWREFLETDERPLNLDIKSQKIPVSEMAEWIPSLSSFSPGMTAEVDLNVTGSLAKPEIKGNAFVENIQIPNRPELPPTSVRLNIDAKDNVAKVEAVATAPDFQPATLTAEMDFFPKQWAENPDLIKSSKIDGELTLPEVDISRFSGLLPEGKSVEGVFSGTVDLAGTVGDPIVDGQVQLDNVGVTLDIPGVADLKGLDMVVDADLKQIKVKGDLADMAGGSLAIDGDISLENEGKLGLGQIRVGLRGTGLPVMRNDFIIVRANADLNISGTMERATISGELGVIDSIFYKDIELIPIGAPFLEPSAASLPKVDTSADPFDAVPQAFKSWPVNLVVKTIDPILIRGNIGSGNVEVGMRIEGTLGNPQPNGKVRINELQASLPFTTLEVQQGELVFTPQTGFDPLLEIRAIAEPRPYRVSAFAYGQLSDPELVLTSQPPLPENEIMTLLATGTTTEGLEDSQAASSRAMQLLIEEIRRGRFLFGKQLRPYLKFLDDVDFSLAESNPYDSREYSSANIKLSERWYLSAGVGSQGDQRLLGIWRLRFK